VEASALQAPAGLARGRVSLGASLLRLRSDEQLVQLFRDGSDEAFRAIHDRYRSRLFAYARQMLPGSRQDAEDALQDVFVKAYAGLRANDRELALRAWLYRVAHNRCIDELRRPSPMLTGSAEPLAMLAGQLSDPIALAEQREQLARLVADVRRLPDQQRSALLMRELSGMSYSELAAALGVSVPAVKSLLVRARISLAQALEARETACSAIREELIVCHDRGVRPTGTARRHLRDCAPCREFRREVRGVSRQFAALAPAIGPVGVLARLLGVGGGAGGAGVGAAAGGGAAVGGGAAAGGAAAATGFLSTTAGHVATLLAAAIVAAGGAVELQPARGVAQHHRSHRPAGLAVAAGAGAAHVIGSQAATAYGVPAPPVTSARGSAPGAAATPGPTAGGPGASGAAPSGRPTDSGGTGSGGGDRERAARAPVSMTLGDPELLPYATQGTLAGGSTGTGTDTSGTGTPGTGTSSTGTSSTGTGSTGTGSGSTGSSGSGTSGTGTGSGSTSGSGSGTGTSGTGTGSTGTGSGSTGSSGGGTSGTGTGSSGSGTSGSGTTGTGTGSGSTGGAGTGGAGSGGTGTGSTSSGTTGAATGSTAATGSGTIPPRD
jgi:RNA polymerase sigma factor (sigma-70 family)